jgi:hypothetical protein
MKDWMKGPFLNTSSYTSVKDETITVYPDLFTQLFKPEDRYSAFDSYHTHYYDSNMTVEKTKVLLENFNQCASCNEWFDRDDLVDTEQMIGGGVGDVCEACADTLG